jgi:hypothetical protein
MLTHDSMAHWLASLDADTLSALMARRPDTLGIPPSSLNDLADRLAVEQSVTAVVRGLNRGMVEVLAAAQSVPGPVTVDAVVERFAVPPDRDAVVTALTELTAIGLVWPVEGDAVELVEPLRVARARGGHLGELHVAPPAPRVVPADADLLDRLAGATALPTVHGITRLVELCSVTPVEPLRSGGVGVKEIRRLAKTLPADERSVRLWLTLAYHADLLDADDDGILPTPAADLWLAGEPAERLLPLLMTWWQLPSAPTAPDRQGKQHTALLHAYDDDDRALRHDLVGWFTDLADDAIVDRDDLTTLMAWWKPYAYGESATVDATVDEAESLGVLAGGRQSSWGRALVTGKADDVLTELARSLPPATGNARLQADLTAVVPGVPTVELAALLDLVADAGERDTASVWRFSPASVRRALDAGHTADRLLAALADVSDDTVPQPLEYLIRDVARRHGELTVVGVGCCVVADDAALLAEVAAHRELRSLGLRLLAPGVLASAQPAERTLELLRANGYAPVAVDSHGAPVLRRVTPRRARPRPRVAPRAIAAPFVPEPPDDLHGLAESLLAAGVEPEPADGGLTAEVRRFGSHLSSQEISWLTGALQRETPVEITYLDSNDRGSRRVITPLEVVSGRVEAWCHLRDDERHFLIERIQHVLPASA